MGTRYALERARDKTQSGPGRADANGALPSWTGTTDSASVEDAAPVSTLRPGAPLHWCRITVGVIGLCASPFIPGLTPPERQRLIVLLAIAWLPWASGAIALLAGRWPRLSPGAPATCDLLVVFAFQASIPRAWVPALFGYLLVVAIYSYLEGRSTGLALGLLAAVLTVLAVALHQPARPDPPTLLSFAAVLFVLVLLFDEAGREQRDANRRLNRLRRKAEAIAARVGDGLAVTTGNGAVVQWNEGAERITGRPATEAIGRRCAAALGLHRGERALDCTRGCALLVAQIDDVGAGVEAWRLRPDGRRQPLVVSVCRIRDPGGDAEEVVHSFRDITRLKEAEEAKSMFLATASHELKTPLTVIRGFSNVMAQAREQDEVRRALAIIERRAIELGRIVDRLLLSSRIEAGHIEVAMTKVAVGAVIRERAEAMAAATDRHIDVRTAPDLPLAAADPDALATVLDHLLDNAGKYSPDGGSLQVAADFNRSRVSVTISDHGIGMDPEQQSRCFDKFWQGESSDARRFGGTGIGLYIVRSLVEAMGGEVSVESALGDGSTFIIHLPRADTPPASADAAEASATGEASVIREFMRQIGVPDRRRQ